MIIRVPDYYETFRCIADACKDSCCIGWEIDIDQDTYEYYRNVEGTFGRRLKQAMKPLKDEEGYYFALGDKGRCPFLNSQNLCDICIELGEEALSEVCTEYPRFSLFYHNTLQKCLSLSCEEVERILFTREEPVTFIERIMEAYGQDAYELEKESLDDFEEEDWEAAGFAFFEQIQQIGIELLQDRSMSIWKRMEGLLSFLECAQKTLDQVDDTSLDRKLVQDIYAKWNQCQREQNQGWHLRHTFTEFSESLDMFSQMEVLNQDWVSEKKLLKEDFTSDNYEAGLRKYLDQAWNPKLENYYENLMVYFFFRYFMQSAFDFQVLSKGLLAVEFTLFIRDMNVISFLKNEKISLQMLIKDVKIFSKEVEHCEENVKYAEESLAFSL